jgi:large subunit ribosomal protein L32e
MAEDTKKGSKPKQDNKSKATATNNVKSKAKDTKSKTDKDTMKKTKTEPAPDKSSKGKSTKPAKPVKTTKARAQTRSPTKTKSRLGKKVTKPKKRSAKQTKGKTSTSKAKTAAVDKDEDEVEIVEDEIEDEEEESEYYVKQKPELTPEMRKKLRLRSEAKRKKPDFKRQEWFRYKRLGEAWRKPRGLHSKLRTNRKYRINQVRVGYKTTSDVRGLHSSGFKEVLVFNKSDLDGIDPKLEAARIGHSVGTRKRIEIEDYADELGIRILNRGL